MSDMRYTHCIERKYGTYIMPYLVFDTGQILAVQ